MFLLFYLDNTNMLFLVNEAQANETYFNRKLIKIYDFFIFLTFVNFFGLVLNFIFFFIFILFFKLNC